jgi:hypothetical protein
VSFIYYAKNFLEFFTKVLTKHLAGAKMEWNVQKWGNYALFALRDTCCALFAGYQKII